MEKKTKKSTIDKIIKSSGYSENEDKIWCSVSCTVQIVSYEPFNITIGRSITPEPKQDPEKILCGLMNRLTKYAITQAETVRENPEEFYEEATDD